jgi:hypothetical protein
VDLRHPLDALGFQRPVVDASLKPCSLKRLVRGLFPQLPNGRYLIGGGAEASTAPGFVRELEGRLLTQHQRPGSVPMYLPGCGEEMGMVVAVVALLVG